MPAAPTMASIKVTKTFSYRGGSRLFSNRYYFTNDAPVDAAKWLAFSDAVVNAEKLALRDDVQIVKTDGYAAGSDVPVYGKTYATLGTIPAASGVRTVGEAAALVRYSTADRTPKNHPIYLFNYYHGALAASSGAPDTLYSGMVSALQGYGTAWVTGISDGTTIHKRTGPYGHTATGVTVPANITHRDFPRG